jgi:metallo-beta-lactamase class B
MCVPVPAGIERAGGRGGVRRIPARETWYAEPAKVADNLYFLGTKVHSAWAIEGSEGIILVEALFDLRRERRDSGRHEKARSG